MSSSRPRPAERPLQITLRAIAAFQFVLGLAFLAVPRPTIAALGLERPPQWTSWLFAMMAARFLGFGVGMVAAARDPHRHRLWIEVMAAVQAIDWVATLVALGAGVVTLRQVTTASFVPVLFVVALLRWRPRAASITSRG